MREIRLYMIGVGITACALRIATYLFTYYEVGPWLNSDGVSRYLSCWW